MIIKIGTIYLRLDHILSIKIMGAMGTSYYPIQISMSNGDKHEIDTRDISLDDLIKTWKDCLIIME